MMAWAGTKPTLNTVVTLSEKYLKAREVEAKADGMTQDLLCCWKPQQERQELGTLKSVTQV